MTILLPMSGVSKNLHSQLDENVGHCAWGDSVGFTPAFCLTFQFSTKSGIRNSLFPSQILNIIKLASRSFLELNCKCRWVKFQTETRNHESRRVFAHIFWTSDVLLDLFKNSLNARKNISENRNINLIIPHLNWGVTQNSTFPTRPADIFPCSCAPSMKPDIKGNLCCLRWSIVHVLWELF